MLKIRLGRVAVALVWLYQGFYLKVLAASAAQASIVGAVPVLSENPVAALRAVGCCESVLGLWVLTGRRLRAAAIAQTVLLVVMNAGGLFWAAGRISDPIAMLLQNGCLLVLVWMLAEKEP